jgi:hypothetical protein
MEEDEVRIDRIIDVIHDVLPCTSYAEIALKVSRKMRESISVGTINNAIAHLRRNSAGYGWTIPHVRRGTATEEGENRYFALPVDRDGVYILDDTTENRMHLNAGSASTMAHTATMMLNQTNALKIAATHTRSANLKAKLLDLADDYGYIARKAAAVVRQMAAGA